MTHRLTFELLFKTKAISMPPLKNQVKVAIVDDERLSEHYLSAGIFALHLNSDIRTS